MNNELIKQELTRVLSSIFGDSIKITIEEYYESNKLEELIELAEHMLTGYMGEENADRLLAKIIAKPMRCKK